MHVIVSGVGRRRQAAGHLPPVASVNRRRLLGDWIRVVELDDRRGDLAEFHEPMRLVDDAEFRDRVRVELAVLHSIDRAVQIRDGIDSDPSLEVLGIRIEAFRPGVFPSRHRQQEVVHPTERNSRLVPVGSHIY